MCELLVSKGNKKNVYFEKEAFIDAMTYNRDGVGYCIFKKTKKGFDLVEMEHFHPDTKPITSSATTSSHTTHNKPVHRHKEEIWIDFEVDGDNKTLELFGINGTHLFLQYPDSFDIEGFEYLSRVEQEVKVEKWMDSKRMPHDFKLLDEYGVTTKDFEIAYENIKTQEQKENVDNDRLTCDTDKLKLADMLFKRQSTLATDELMITHFRAKTKGTGQINTQPIEVKDFIVMHNGVFTGLGEEKFSDTIQFVANLSALYNAGDISGKNEQDFIEAYLEQTAGWWSMFIYSKKTKQLYYFRDGGQFNKFADGLLYSTKSERFPIHAEDAPTFAV